MKHLIATSLLFIAVSVRAATNEHAAFLLDAHAAAAAYDEATLKKWNMGGDRAAVPESADHRNLEHVRLLIAANPDRYEGYVMYGLHFFLKRQYDVAVAAYEKATEIVTRQKISDTVEYGKYYNLSLIMLYREQREDDKAVALDTFGKLARRDLEFFGRETKLADVLALAALDYYAAGRRDEAKELIERSRGIKDIPDSVRKTLESIHERIGVEQTRGG